MSKWDARWNAGTGAVPGGRVDRRDFLKAGVAFLGGLLAAGHPREADGGRSAISLTPVLRIRSGDVVVIETGVEAMDGMVLSSGTEEWVRAFREEMAKDPQVRFYPGPARLAGPIDVEGAEPGEVLEIAILEAAPAPCGFNVRPEPGNGRTEWFRTDRRTYDFGSLPAARIPLRPFPETLGVLRPGAEGKSGGPAWNLGCGDLVAGTALYIPVRVRGAGVVAGDSRLRSRSGGLDDGALDGAARLIVLRVTVRRDPAENAGWPFISTPSHWIVPAVRGDLRAARGTAAREAARFLSARFGMTGEEARSFVRGAADFRVARVGDSVVGVHALIPRSAVEGEDPARGRRAI